MTALKGFLIGNLLVLRISDGWPNSPSKRENRLFSDIYSLSFGYAV
jgi:hypothetical protein